MTRTAELTAKLLDGALSDAECAELEALVTSDPGAAAEHIALLELEVELRALRTDFDLTDATLNQIQEAQSERTADAVLTEIANRTAPTWTKTVPRYEAESRRAALSGWGLPLLLQSPRARRCWSGCGSAGSNQKRRSRTVGMKRQCPWCSPSS